MFACRKKCSTIYLSVPWLHIFWELHDVVITITANRITFIPWVESEPSDISHLNSLEDVTRVGIAVSGCICRSGRSLAVHEHMIGVVVELIHMVSGLSDMDNLNTEGNRCHLP